MTTNFNSRGITVSTPNGDMSIIQGSNMRIQPSGNSVNFSSITPFGSIINGNGLPWLPPALADAVAPNNSIYFSTNAGKLVYKDNTSPTPVIHPLY